MSASIDPAKVRRASYPIDPEATAHELLNDATKWLQYARSLAELLADLVHESDPVDGKRMALSLEAIGALTHIGLQCTAQAHARVCWEQGGLPM